MVVKETVFVQFSQKQMRGRSGARAGPRYLTEARDIIFREEAGLSRVHLLRPQLIVAVGPDDNGGSIPFVLTISALWTPRL